MRDREKLDTNRNIGGADHVGFNAFVMSVSHSPCILPQRGTYCSVVSRFMLDEGHSDGCLENVF